MPWRVTTGEMTGPYHLKVGEESQDSMASWSDGDSTVLIATDGAGSLKQSKYGSHFVADSLLKELTSLLKSGADFSLELLEEAYLKVRKELLSHANYKEMGCTLACAVTIGDKWWSLVLGDAFVVVHRNEDNHLFLQPERKGEYANITELITSDNPTTLLEEGEGLVGVSASTDGLLHCSVDSSTNTPTKGFWSPLLRLAQKGELSLDKFLHFLDSKDRIDDDTTILMAVKD